MSGRNSSVGLGWIDPYSQIVEIALIHSDSVALIFAMTRIEIEWPKIDGHFTSVTDLVRVASETQSISGG